MKKAFRRKIWIVLLFIIFSVEAHTQEKDSVEVIRITSGFSFTEGPACDKNGNIYFSDIPNNRIFRWNTNRTLDTFRNNSGGANGLFIGGDGSVYACEGISRRLTMTDQTGNVTVIDSLYNDKKLNQPNDLWIDPKGGIYFTDPFYTGDPKIIEQDGKHVYYISPNHKSIIRVINDYEMPNGIVGTPDGKILYVTDASGGKTWKYKISENGTLTDKALLTNEGSDGMTLDKDGNIYLTNFKTSAVDVFSTSGNLLMSVKIPETPTNVCFGNNMLYVTAHTSLYALKLNVSGFRKNVLDYVK